ncbi:putative transposase-associated domain-containing protein [Tanacetum coccineum]
MYPFERCMKVIKGHVRNRNRPEGCIAEETIAEETIEFFSEYHKTMKTIGIPPDKHVTNENEDGKPLSAGKSSEVSGEVFQKAHLYVIQNTDEIVPYIERHKQVLKTKNPGKRIALLENEHSKSFAKWLREEVERELAISKDSVSETVRWISYGPRATIVKYEAYNINGYTFRTKSNDGIVYQNSGVSVEAVDLHISKEVATTRKAFYYGVLQEIWVLDYRFRQIPLFKCDWVNHKAGGVKHDPNLGYTLVDLNSLGHKDDPFILASQARQVFYVKDQIDKKLSIVFRTPTKNYKDTYDEVDEEFSTVIHEHNDNILPRVNRRDLGNESQNDYYRTDCEVFLMMLKINVVQVRVTDVHVKIVLLMIFKEIYQVSTAKVKIVNGVVQLQALIDGKKVFVLEAIIRRDLHLEDAKGVECLPNNEIFEELARIGYEKPPPNLTFYKAFFAPQWKFLIHTLIQCLSAKRTAWNEFSSNMASAVICLATGRKFNFSKYIFNSMLRNVDSSAKFLMYPQFIQVFLDNQVDDMTSHHTKYTSPALTQKVFANIRRVGKGFSGNETPLFDTMLVQPQTQADEDVEMPVDEEQPATTKPTHSSPHDSPLTGVNPPRSEEGSLLLAELMALCTSLQREVDAFEKDRLAQATEILSLNKRVEKLEKRRKLKPSVLRRLRKIGSATRVESSEEASLVKTINSILPSIFSFLLSISRIDVRTC